jgi:hypothetical protein
MSDIHEAIINNNVNFFKKEINKGFDPSECQNRHLIHAAQIGSVDIVKLFLKDPRVDPSVYSPRHICYGILNGDTMQSFIYPINAFNTASYHGHLEIVDILLSDPRTEIREGLKIAQINGFSKIVERILEEPSIKGFSKERQTISKKIFFIGMLRIPEELNDKVLQYLFKNPSIFPDYVPDKGFDPWSCVIL